MLALVLAGLLGLTTACGSSPLPPPLPFLHVDGNRLVDSRTDSTFRLIGVDVSGTQTSCIQDKGFGLGPLNASEARAVSEWHVNSVRVPLNEDCWLGINGAPKRYSGPAYRARIVSWVSALNNAGLVAILDLHDSAPGDILATGSWDLPDSAHAVAFWRSVATTFRRNTAVMFDVFNEPALGASRPTAGDWSCWRDGCNSTYDDCTPQAHGAIRYPFSRQCGPVAFHSVGMQALINTVRATGATQPLLIAGLDWAAQPCDFDRLGGGQCAWSAAELDDPEHNLVVSYHAYYASPCTDSRCWSADLGKLPTLFPVVTGEFGDKTCTTNYDVPYMNWADAHGVSYLAWSWQPGSPRAPCGQNDLRLISGFSGATDRLAPGPADIRGHLAKLKLSAL